MVVVESDMDDLGIVCIVVFHHETLHYDGKQAKQTFISANMNSASRGASFAVPDVCCSAILQLTETQFLLLLEADLLLSPLGASHHVPL